MNRLRRLTHPILLWLYKRYAANSVLSTNAGGFRLRIFPSVFHPKYFGSSLILARYVESLDVGGQTFLDMGTGSGIVGLFAARAGAHVTGVDINPEAVRCASENAAACGLAIEYFESDLFSALGGREFDFIAWNPPFFPRSPSTQADAALYGGASYDVLARFARQSRAHLSPKGHVILVLSLDLDVAAIEAMFLNAGYTTRRAVTQKWGFGETMVVIDMTVSA